MHQVRFVMPPQILLVMGRILSQLIIYYLGNTPEYFHNLPEVRSSV
ncbi:uncharacterized protein METZ01_LOCUS392086 [marine metagenome]|uniref:Uncharacterized protein n=1 Tax=marine metagenome TaxID=408172 RepID=A0A382UY87_9ZZZZ